MASEFYVMSVLHRLGLDANLTLGNKKSVDIAVVLGPGHAITIDVKAVAKKYDWPMGNVTGTARENHFLVLVSYEGRFSDPEKLPSCWVLRHDQVLENIKTAKGQGLRFLPRKVVVQQFSSQLGAWHLLVSGPSQPGTRR